MLENTDLVFPGFPANSSYCARTSDLWRVNHHQFGSGDDLWRWGAECLLCVQDFVRSPHFTQRSFFSDSGIVSWLCSHLWQDHAQCCFRAMEPCGDYISFSGCGWRVWVREWGSWSAEGGERLTRAVVCGGWYQAIVGRFDIPIRCQDFKCRGRGASRVRSSTCPLFLFLLVPVIYVFRLGSQKSGQLVGALWRDASKLQVPLQHFSNILLLRIWVFVPLWTELLQEVTA